MQNITDEQIYSTFQDYPNDVIAFGRKLLDLAQAQTSNEEKTDWKGIATTLAQRVNFAMQHLKAPSGSAGMMDMKTGEFTPWREYLAEAMEAIPGIKIDREIMALLDLPPAKRRKAIQALKEKREAEQAKGGV